MKQPGLIAYTGLGLCCSGELLRKCAMLTAGSNFHHLVRVKREEDHRLVTTGVYSVCRHPSYAGWFLWSVGTQVHTYLHMKFVYRPSNCLCRMSVSASSINPIDVTNYASNNKYIQASPRTLRGGTSTHGFGSLGSARSLNQSKVAGTFNRSNAYDSSFVIIRCNLEPSPLSLMLPLLLLLLLMIMTITQRALHVEVRF